MKRHSPEETAFDGRELVVAEIDAADRPQQVEDLVQFLLARRELGRRFVRAVQVRMARQVDELRADGARVEHEVDHPGCNGGAGHAVVLRRRRILRHRDAAGRFDLAYAQRAVGRRARQDDADRARSGSVGQRGEERVDGRVLGAIVGACAQMERPADDDHLRVRRNHVDVIRLDVQAVRGLHDRHRRLARQQRDERALMLRREVLHEHDRDVWIRRERLEQR